MSEDTIDRRTFVRSAIALAAATPTLAGCVGASTGAGSDGAAETTPTPTPAATKTPSGTADRGSFDGWMEDVGNYDGVVDKTGAESVTVTVGAKGNGGHFAFAPAAIRVSTGTKVVWEWTGKGGSHNVVAQSGADFESTLTGEAGHTFSRTFEEAGTIKYYCQPHKTMGMNGVVVVG